MIGLNPIILISKCEWTIYSPVKETITIYTKAIFMCCLQETCTKDKDMDQLKLNGWRKTHKANSKLTRSGIAILIPGKIDYKTYSMNKAVANIL